MAVEIFVKDPLRQAVNTVMYDDKGYPSVMVRILSQVWEQERTPLLLYTDV